MLSMVGLFRLSVLPHLHRSFTWSRPPRPCQNYSKYLKYPNDSTPRLIQLPRRHRYHSGPKTLHPNKAPSGPFLSFAVATLAGLGYAVHLYSSSVPLVLEAGSLRIIDKDFIQALSYEVPTPLSPDQADAILRWKEETRTLGDGGILRTDRVCVPSNEPCEDEHFSQKGVFDINRYSSTYGNMLWMMWGVFDGHV